MPSYRGEVPLLHPEYPAGSAAASKAVNSEDIATVRIRGKKYYGSLSKLLITLDLRDRKRTLCTLRKTIKLSKIISGNTLGQLGMVSGPLL